MLLLFDIDGTLLLRASEAHAQAMHDALRRVHGIADPAAAHVQAAGRTDPEIARAILLDLGVPARRIDERMNDVRIATAEAYARLCPRDLSEHVAPGMPALLEHLAGRKGVRLSLVTGNFEPVARMKLRAAGIGRYFPSGQGGFGSDHEDRTELPAIARRRAGGDGRSYPRERTIVIGDTPRDVACAQADGIRCLAVATGSYRPEQLTGADHVARSVPELRRLLDEVL